MRLRGRISSSGPNFVLRTRLRLRGRISSSGPNFVFRAEFRLSRPNFVCRAEFLVFRTEFRLRSVISFSGPNFVFAAEFRLQGRISRLQRSIPEPRTLSNSVFGPNSVFRTNLVFTNEFRLQRTPNRISSSQECRLHGRFSSSHFVLAHNLASAPCEHFVLNCFGISASEGGTKPGPTLPGPCVRVMIVESILSLMSCSSVSVSGLGLSSV